MAKPDCSVPKELARMEQEKRRGYGQGPSNPNTLFDRVVPVIFEQHGCPNQCATTFLYHILRRRVAKLEQSSHLTHGVAWMIAARELYAPIFLHSVSDAPPNVSGMQSHCPNVGQTQGALHHGWFQCPLPAQLPWGAVA